MVIYDVGDKKMGKYIMAFDAGTTSSRCILFDKNGRIRCVAQKEFTQRFPKPGWVEHDAKVLFMSRERRFNGCVMS